jgi:transposase InsO family protein
MIWLIRGRILPRGTLLEENLALRQQLLVYQRRIIKRPKLYSSDRHFWVWLSQFWKDWKSFLFIVQPETVIKWHWEGFRLYWKWKSKTVKVGRPKIEKEVRGLIRQTVAVDFFAVPTINFRLLYCLVVLRHDRREVVHFNVTAHPTAIWTAQQIVNAFPEDTAPKYLIRDRDAIYGEYFRQRIKNLGIKEVIIAPCSPWQNPFAERVIGSIRRECLDHVIIFNEDYLRRVLSEYFGYYHQVRTHQSLDRNSPIPREVEQPAKGKVISIPMVGGLHHQYRKYRRVA